LLKSSPQNKKKNKTKAESLKALINNKNFREASLMFDNGQTVESNRYYSIIEPHFLIESKN